MRGIKNTKYAALSVFCPKCYYLSTVQINPLSPSPSRSTTDGQSFRFSVKCVWPDRPPCGDESSLGGRANKGHVLSKP